MLFNEAPDAFALFSGCYSSLILHQSNNVTFMWILRFDENLN